MAAVAQAIVELALERSPLGAKVEGLTKAMSRLDALTCIASPSKRIASMRAAIRRHRLEQVRRVVDKHLTSPSLQAAFLCKTVGISRSGLYRLFEGSGGVARYIQRQRLLRAHATLSDPTNRSPILSIADEFCFADASSFSRAFRKEFGCRPSDVAFAAADVLYETDTGGQERFANPHFAV